jgi:anti-anti-sigma regulatory factor
MLKLERTDAADGTVTLFVHGRVGGEWVTELERACAMAIDGGARPLRLDLTDVTYIDQAGLALFRRLWPHLTILRSSLFAAELLRPLTARVADQ